LLVSTAAAAAPSPVEDPANAASPPPVGQPARRDAFPDQSEAEVLTTLRALEATLSLGSTPSRAELEDVATAATSSPHAPVRALAVSVLAWLDPTVATAPLLAAWSDDEARVRAAVAQSLLSLARRLADDDRARIIAGALSHLDDASDEVACASVELLGALAPTDAADAVRVRAAAAGDVRYACFSRIGGLPVRAVELPPRATVVAVPTSAPEQIAPSPSVPGRDASGTWLLIGTAASAGFVAAALFPSGLVPSRDVLSYDDDASRITREEVSVLSQLGAGVLGAAALGGGAYLLEEVLPLNVAEAGAVAIATGSVGLVGASAQLAFALREGPAAYATAAGLALGLAGGAGLAMGLHLDVDDEVLAASSMALGGFGAGLIVFSAVPVGFTNIGDAQRQAFGLGIAGMGAGAAGFVGLAAGAFVDVRAARSFTVLLGGVIGGGLGTALGFLSVPPSTVQSRIACAVGVSGLLIGITAGVLVPDTWLPPLSVGPAVVVDEGALSFGVPVLAPVGRDGIGATLVYARF
jgi:hypothetical protein